MTIRFEALAKADLSEVLARPRKTLSVTHPGQFLLGEFMEPHELTANALANALHVPANRITAILKGQRGISADTALRLARYFGTTADFWLNLQKDYELRQARQVAQRKIDALVTPMTA
jgi:addiction module HigA family antidote